ncbi:spondin domain-containing protein [Colwellia sp. RSH04]|uniref:spondin domain-containing protein n=1 Tax=Colwellia sp. RSH04 TaxID=2305464 RepID=UPI0015FC62EA|nr:spondin domain-containing protein [Colwellia sp. RSH04]
MSIHLFNKRTALMLTLAATLTACGSDNDDNMTEPPPPQPEPMEYSYDITVVNLTHEQPLSPITAVLHADGKMWDIGMSSSIALEKLAEGGDNTDFISQESVIANASAQGPLMPGLSETLTITTTDELATHLTMVSMLVNTNDAFSGLTNLELSTLDVDATMSWHLAVYDAGTEANTEAMGTIPGPADGGTGYSMIRDDVDRVSMHSGVVSQDDGLMSSVLTQAHRFDNPSIKLTITRTK